MTGVLKTVLTVLLSPIAVACTMNDPVTPVAVDSTVNETVLSQELCEDILSSFSIAPTFQQNATERRRLLAVIKAAQEDRYGDLCGGNSGWKESFDNAYWEAYANAKSLDIPDGATMLDRSSYIADPECFMLLSKYSKALMARSEGVLVEDIREELSRIDQSVSRLDCSGDLGWRLRYQELWARSVASGVIIGAS